MKKLYHRDIGIPEHLLTPLHRKVRLEYSRHAMREAANDKFGIIQRLPLEFNLRPEFVVEVESFGNVAVTKAVVRVPYEPNRDLILVIIPNGNDTWFVKTLWTNSCTDNHKTLNKQNYARPT